MDHPVYRCSCKFLDFLSLIFSMPIFKDTISGFEETNQNTLNTIGVFVLVRAISWCTSFKVNSVTAVVKKIYFSVFIQQPVSVPLVSQIFVKFNFSNILMFPQFP